MDREYRRDADDAEVGGADVLTVERNSKGYNWKIRLVREEGEPLADWVARVAEVDDLARRRWGGGL